MQGLKKINGQEVYLDSKRVKNSVIDLSGASYTATPGSYTEVTGLNEKYKIGKELTTENNRVIIGNGISYVICSATVMMRPLGTGTKVLRMILKRGGTEAVITQAQYSATGTGYNYVNQIVIPPALVPVKKKDSIYLKYYSASGADVISSANHETRMTVEVKN